MQCQRCRGQLVTKSADRDGPYECTGCRGAWVPGALATAQAAELGKAATAVHAEPFAAVDAHEVSDRVCVSCADQALRIVWIRNLEIDVCPGCHGVYFDEGELAQVLPELVRQHEDEGFSWKSSTAEEALSWVLEEVVCAWFS